MWVEQNGSVWRIRDRVNGRKVTLEEGFLNKTMASSRLVILLSEQMRGEALVPQAGRITVGELVDEWWPVYSEGLKPTALHSEGGRVRHHIRGLLADVALDDFDPRRWVADLTAGNGAKCGKRKRVPLAPKTVHNCHALMYTIMDYAVERRYIRANPCRSGRARRYLPKRIKREMYCMTDPEIGRLMAAVPEHWRPLVRLLLATGLRWGEAVGLKAGRLDLLAEAGPRLRVAEHMHELGDGSLIFTSPKTERSCRTVSFPVGEALDLTPLVAGKEPDALVFTTPTGRPVRTRNFRRGWLKWRIAAGLPTLRVHDLRHTHAGILLSEHNLSISKISRRLGHSSVAVTDQLYGHIREEHDERIIAAIEAAMSGGEQSAAVEADVTAELVDETERPAGFSADEVLRALGWITEQRAQKIA